MPVVPPRVGRILEGWGFSVVETPVSEFLKAGGGCRCLTLALDALAGGRFLVVPTTLAILGVGLMLAACVLLIREARIALRNNRLEILFYQKLRNLRAAKPAASPEEESPPVVR